MRAADLCIATFALYTCVAFSACGKSEPPPVTTPPAPITKSAPPTPIAQKKVELGGATWDPQWDQIVERALPPEMLSRQVPQDVRRFCPLFYQLQDSDKRTFWAYFFQALAGAEAGLDPTSRVRQTQPAVAKRDTVTGLAVRSEGLLQLDYEDGKRYGCAFDWHADRALKPDDPAKTILLPLNNLVCGVRILDNQIIVHHKPLLSQSGYWSTLRPGTVSYRVFAKQMSNPPPACGYHPVHHAAAHTHGPAAQN